jgi:type I restriction enzyme, S subunit
MTVGVTELGDVVTVDRTAASKEECRDLPYVGLEHIEKDIGVFIPQYRRLPESLLATKFRFTPHHVLYGKLRPYLNKVVRPNFDGVCTTEILPLLPDTEVLDAKYLYYLLQSSQFVCWASHNVSGANLPRLDPKMLDEYQFRLRPIPEQKAVAANLQHAQELCHMRRYALELSDAFLSAAFLQLFGDPIRNPSGFDLVQLEDELQCIESGFSPVCEGPRESSTQWAVLGLGAVTAGIFKPDENKRLPDNVVPRPELEVHDGDILVTRKNTYDLVAASAYVRNPPPRLLLPDTIFRFRLKQRSQLSPVFLWGLLSFPSFRKSVQRLASGSAGSMPGISKEKFMTVRCPAPPPHLQEKFSDLARRHEQLRAIHVEAIRQAEHLFQTLLHQAFSPQ